MRLSFSAADAIGSRIAPLFLFALCTVNGWATDDHLLICEVVVTPTDQEFIEIANPTGSPVSLDNYYLSDDEGYALLPGAFGAGPAPSIGSTDFIARFPAGSSIAPSAVVVVAFDGAGFFAHFGFRADFEIHGTDAATPDMLATDVGATAGLTNSGEHVVLFHWDGASDLVDDVDMVNVGTPSATNDIGNKTGLSVDGPDGDTMTSTYAADAGTMPQQAGDPGFGVSTKRTAPESGQESTGGGNGITDDDETTEQITATWDGPPFSAPDPGLCAILGPPPLFVNEVDTVTGGGETEEFIEIFDGGRGNFALDGKVVVLFDGTTDQSYAAFDLDGLSTDADGFFLIGGADVPGIDDRVGTGTGIKQMTASWLQDGADAVALYDGDDTDFPNGTAVTATGLNDALVYDTGDADDSGLLTVLTPGQAQIDENGMGDQTGHSNSRHPDGGTQLETDTYTQKLPTPGYTNIASGAEVVINEFVANHSGEDTHEFIEILGLPSTDYSALSILAIEGDAEDNPGLIVSVYPVGTTDAEGLWFTGFLEDELDNGSYSLFLVEGFSGMVNDDLDGDDDGVLNTQPWTFVHDTVGADEADLGDWVYANTALTAFYDGQVFVPGGASRIPNGIDTDRDSDWVRNDFDGAGLPGKAGTVDAGEAANTPGETNNTDQPPPPLIAIINEFVADHVGADDHEYVEILGEPVTDYSALRILQLDGDSGGNPGRVDSVHTPGTTDIGGFWDTGFLTDTLDNGTLTLYLVEGWTGSVAADLDADDDGVLETKPWTNLLDSVCLFDGDGGDRLYSATVLDVNLRSLQGVLPGGASRIPNGADTDSEADWLRNDFDGAGLMGFPGSLAPGEALNTPGAYNATTPSGGNDAIINEFVASHTGIDDHEYLEILGSADTNYSHLWVVQLEGDTESNPGTVDTVHQVGTTNAQGYWFSGFLENQFGNGSQTLLLVDSFSGSLGQDLDTNDDGVLETMPWTALLDDVAVGDDGPGDQVYSTSLLNPNYDGDFFTPGGASRIPNGTDTDTTGDWKRNDFFGIGLPGFPGGLDPHEAINTPNADNADELPPGTGAILSEFVADHAGADTHEFLEIFGTAQRSYHTTYILVLDGNAGGNPGMIEHAFQAGDTGANGFWDTGFLSPESIDNGSISILVVEEFTGMAGDDLDTNNDGILDSQPWSVLADALALDDGDPGDFTYAAVVLDGNFRGGATHPGGASRFPYGIDNDLASDWIRNDFDGAGLDPGFGGTVDPGEARNTPGNVTNVNLTDYYAGLDTTDGANLRSGLHAVIADHVRFPYTADVTDSWDVLELADEDPNNANNILGLYKNAVYAKEGGGNDNYNREHTWPSSYGFPVNIDENYPYTDFHHLRLSDSGYNSTRSNIAYGNCNAGCNEAPTDVNNGQGGGSGVYPGNSNWYTGNAGSGTFEVWIGRRGDVARGLLYLDVRYEGGSHGVTGFSEPDMVLTDNTGLIQTSGGVNLTGEAYMGRLSALLEWHRQDPVDQLERERNEIVYAFQGNRNPFVDNPQWVDCIFEDNCSLSCLFPSLADWLGGDSFCPARTSVPEGVNPWDVKDYVAIVNGTCTCP